MIAHLHFDTPDACGVRRARFVPRISIPLGAACLVANGMRETLRELLGERCDLSIGEPAAIDANAWRTVARDAYCFLTGGRQTDIVLVISTGDARTLVQHAFGEAPLDDAPALSALELQAVERIAARCAATFDPLYAERRTPSRRLCGETLPACVGYFDVRVSTPIAIDLGIGIVRDLPDPGPSGTLPVALLGGVPLTLSAQFAVGTINARSLLGLGPGDVIPFSTQVGSSAVLKIEDRCIAEGTGGISGAHYSFEVHSMTNLGAQS